jgi:hypothetical protein
MDSLPRKFPWHDFKRPGWYLITLHCAVRGRNVLAAVRERSFEPTRLGEIAGREWRRLCEASEGALVTQALQIMPDHMHALLHVAKPLPRPLGSLVGAYKAAVTTAARSEIGFTRDRPLWSPGFDWEIKTTPEAVASSRLYVEGNPAAAREKRAAKRRWGAARPIAHRRLPTAWPGDPESGALSWTAFGNDAILDAERIVAVRVSQREPDDRLLRMEERARALAREGAVIATPAISPGEKRALEAALGAGGCAILLESRPIDVYYKPGPRRLSALGEGRLLALSPIERASRRLRLTRDLCEGLNVCAKEIEKAAAAAVSAPAPCVAFPARAPAGGEAPAGVPLPRR